MGEKRADCHPLGLKWSRGAIAAEKGNAHSSGGSTRDWRPFRAHIEVSAIDEAKYHDTLLKEYAEAGALCRNIEQLTRTSLSLFVPAATALAGFVVAPSLSPLTKLVLAVAGLAYALLLVNTVHRNRAYYSKYVARAKEIESLIKRESALVMSLYTSGAEVAKSSRTFSNKLAIAAVFWLAAAYFLCAAIVYTRHVFGAASAS